VRSLKVLCSLLLLAACSANDANVVVDVSTDLLPGTEFVAARATLRGETRSVPATGADRYVGGIRVAEFANVPLGEHSVLVELVDPAGEVVVEETVGLTIRGDYGYTSVFTRSCLNVECVSGERCLDGNCVSAECGDGAEPCGEIVCEAPGDCVASVPACVGAVCTGIACLWELLDERCAAGERCDGIEGCVPLEMSRDGGLSDGAVDGGPPDAGPLDGGSEGGCMLDSDCPADITPDFGMCRRGSVMGPFCLGGGMQTRTNTRWECVVRTCVPTEEVEERSCTLDVEGSICGTAEDRFCFLCMGGTCVPLDGNESCDLGSGFIGACYAGVCCYGCRDGSSCVERSGQLDTRCGVIGETCRDCTATGQTCTVVMTGGRCDP